MVFRKLLTAPASRVALRPLHDLAVAVSAWPMALNPIIGFRVTDTEIEVTG